MKKSGFTMIELIFVIVVLGILAAVALPKFQKVGEQAHVGNLKSFTGTLNGTVGPSVWSKAVTENEGNISKQLSDDGETLADLTDIPKEIKKSDLKKCDDPNKIKMIAIGDEAVNGAKYAIGCAGGNGVKSPAFYLYKTAKTATAHNLGDVNNSDDTLIFPK